MPSKSHGNSSTCSRGILAHTVGPCLGNRPLVHLHAGRYILQCSPAAAAACAVACTLRSSAQLLPRSHHGEAVLWPTSHVPFIVTVLIVSEKGGRCKLQVDISATITVASPTMRQHPYTCIVPAMIIMQCWRGSLLFYAVLTSACTLGSLRLEYTPPACSTEYPRPCPLSLILKPHSCLPP
jgi:hypothetical protein